MAVLDAAAVSPGDAPHEQRLQALAEREAALARERQAIEASAQKEADRLRRARDKAADAYDAAMKRWRG